MIWFYIYIYIYIYIYTHWKRLWCWEGLGAGREGDDRGRDGWMASPTWWMWVWVNSGSWWWTGRPGVLCFMGSQRVGHDWATELNWTDIYSCLSILFISANLKLLTYPCPMGSEFKPQPTGRSWNGTKDWSLNSLQYFELCSFPPGYCYLMW